MRNRSLLPLLLSALAVLALLAFGGSGLLGQLTDTTTPAPPSTAAAAPGGTAPSGPAPAVPAPAADNPSGLPAIRESELPAEGRRVLALIRAGGPYQYSQDDRTFGNFERLLPRRDRGYYREYTVPTPGESDRGARRIVAGGGGEKYYTEDHYESFKFIAEGS
ncbi:ribonuclease [Pseudarthrobacter sp. NamE2]|uniref:ribonuclease domain-containing protein n=1 Tax=Pseudarthrobacter sp. NamE2 TaxID=2576838 RepID=UPI0010FF4855|nr:ribonuclease domain-containing protein [Pseudarthrobacter sp. NamE2]TLM81188.1 ribonuclease [Pseudarthrobacter sp. NamE2]